MSSLAILLKKNNNYVIGEDVNDYIQTEDSLKENNINILPLNSYKNIDADIYIIGHSFEDKIIIENKIVISYSVFLSFYLNKKGLVSICGSHGKTSMVGLLSHLINSSYLRGDGRSDIIKNSNKFVLESCEYKDHFLYYNPEEIILLNIDYDHCDYFKDYKQYLNSFIKFLSKAKRSYVPYKLRNKFINSITIGKSKKADFSYQNVIINKDYMEFDIYSFSSFALHIKTKLKGIQFIKMLTFCYAFCKINDIDFDINKIETFESAKRRFNIVKIINSTYIIDDYAHHHKQIKMHYDNIKMIYKNYKYVAIFEPDRYSRFNKFKSKFKKALLKFDYIYILPFPDMDENVNKSNRLIKHKRIKYIESINEMKILNEDNVIYSFMSSKEMKENIEVVIKKLKNK